MYGAPSCRSGELSKGWAAPLSRPGWRYQAERIQKAGDDSHNIGSGWEDDIRLEYIHYQPEREKKATEEEHIQRHVAALESLDAGATNQRYQCQQKSGPNESHFQHNLQIGAVEVVVGLLESLAE